MGQHHPGAFLSLTLGLTWLLGLLAAATDEVIPGWGTVALYYLGGIVPLAVAAGFVYLGHDRSFQRDFWWRIVDFRRISPIWYVIIFTYAPLKTVLAAGTDILLGGKGMEPETVTRLVDQPLFILPTLVFWLFFGPVPEEPGWRGYALDGLLARRSAVSASLIVGSVWAVWHLPLFFISGTWQAETIGWGTQRFWLFLLTTVTESVLYTWIYTATGRSTLAAILFHFTGNTFGELFALSARAEVYCFALALVTVTAVTIIWGPRTLAGPAGRPRRPPTQGRAERR